jgi:predicted transcriptional regulator
LRQVFEASAKEPSPMPTTATTCLTMATDVLITLLPDAEAEVMRLIWREGCATVKQIHRLRAQHHDLAYTTTMTTIAGLAEKGVLTRQREGLAYIYTPVMSEQAFIVQRLADILGAVERDYPAALTQYMDARIALA